MYILSVSSDHNKSQVLRIVDTLATSVSTRRIYLWKTCFWSIVGVTIINYLATIMLNPFFRRCKTHLPFEHITSIKFLPHHHHPSKNKSIAEKRCLIAERKYIILFHKHTFRRTNILVLRIRLSWYYLSSSLNVLTGLDHDYTYLELLI